VRAKAIIWAIPGPIALTVPFASTVAMDVALVLQLKITSDNSWLFWSNAWAMNCRLSPTTTVWTAGDTLIKEIDGTGRKKLPSTRVPGLKAFPPLPSATLCGTKFPVVSGERVND